MTNLNIGNTDRAQMFGLLLAGTMTGLPIPVSVHFDDGLSVTLDKDDRDAVDRWAAFLNLPRPEPRNYSGGHASYSAFKGAGADGSWRAARCEIDPTDAERAGGESR